MSRRQLNKVDHACELPNEDSRTFLPPLPSNPSFWQRFKRALKKSTLISHDNPRCIEFYRSSAEVLYLRKKQVEANSCIIHPLSIFRVYYEMLMAVVFLIYLVYFPYHAAFDLHEERNERGLAIFWLHHMHTALSAICCFDIFLRFMTGYTDDKQKTVIMEPKTIALTYIKHHFFTDVISSLPNAGLFTSYRRTVKIIEILSLFKLTRIFTASRYVTRSAEFFHFDQTSSKVAAIVFFTLMLFHWTACILFLVPQIRWMINGEYHEDNWIVIDTYSQLIHREYLEQYLVSLYKATGHLFCIRFDYGSYKAWEETLAVCIIYSFGKLFFAYLTVMISQIILADHSLETKYFAIVEQVENFMLRNNLPLSMRRRMLQFYEYKYSKTFFKEKTISGLLSDQLSKEIQAETLHRLLTTVPIFSELSPTTLADILSHLHPEIYLPNDIIIRAGAVEDFICFLFSGTVSVHTPSGREICHLHDGAYFGEVALLLKKKNRTATVIAIEICEIYKMNRKSFVKCFKDIPKVLKRLQVVAQERVVVTQMFEDLHISEINKH